MIYIKTFNLKKSLFNKKNTDEEINKFCDSVNIIENGIKVTNEGVIVIQYMDKDLGFKDEYHEEVLNSNISNLKEKLIRAKINLIIAIKKVNAQIGTGEERAEAILHKQKCKFTIDKILNDIQINEEVAADIAENGLDGLHVPEEIE